MFKKEERFAHRSRQMQQVSSWSNCSILLQLRDSAPARPPLPPA